MSETTWELLLEVSRGAEFEILRGLLESRSIPVNIVQEGYAHVYFGVSGIVQIFVPNTYIEEARGLLRSHGWKLEIDEAENEG